MPTEIWRLQSAIAVIVSASRETADQHAPGATLDVRHASTHRTIETEGPSPDRAPCASGKDLSHSRIRLTYAFDMAVFLF